MELRTSVYVREYVCMLTCVHTEALATHNPVAMFPYLWLCLPTSTHMHSHIHIVGSVDVYLTTTD